MTEAPTETGVEIVAARLAELEAALAALKGSELAFLEKLLGVARKHLEANRTRINDLATHELDPWKTFWCEKPTLGQFKSKVSTTKTAPEVWKELVAAGWITERAFNRKLWFHLAVPEGLVIPEPDDTTRFNGRPR